jgi:minor histocompatibility antigen H13
MAEPSSAIQLVEQAFDQFLVMRPILLTYTHLILSALLPIYAGAHASLSRPSSAAKPKKKAKTADEDEGDEEDDDEWSDKKPKMEGLEPSDALVFPLVAGLTLGVLYFIIKWLEDPAVLNKILSFYFSQMGLFFTTTFLADGLVVARSFVFPASYSSRGNQWKVEQSNMLSIASKGANDQARAERKSPLPGLLGAIPLPTAILGSLWTLRGLVYQKLRLRLKVRNLANIRTRFGILDVIGAGTALVAVAYFAFVAKPWWMTNLLGFSFCYGSLQFMSPSTFLTGSLILSSLFLYDIYFVFFTPLMVTVATKLDVPIKLLIPRPADPGSDSKELSLAMLGLGDIVVPGMMIGLALRFDLYMYYKYKSTQKTASTKSEQDDTKPIYQNATGKWGERFWTCSKPVQSLSLEPPYSDAQAFPKPYFHASIVGYIVGMITTLTVMQFWNHAQPALLYLVPSVLISLWGTALCRGELGFMSAFSDISEDSEDESSSEKDAGNENAKSEDKRGLFARIWSGDVKTPFEKTETSKDDDLQKKEMEKETPNSTTKTESGDNKVAQNTSKKEPKKKDDANERHIFSLSISLPKKVSGSQKTSSEGTSTD